MAELSTTTIYGDLLVTGKVKNFNYGSNSFAGNGEVTIAHGLKDTPDYVDIVPTADPSGYLGEMWVRKDATNIYVGNSGTHTGTFDWMAFQF